MKISKFSKIVAWSILTFLLALNAYADEKGYVLGRSIWANPTISVCWENLNSSTQQQRNWVRDAVTRTWQAHSSVVFVDWNACNSVGPRQSNNLIRIEVADEAVSGPHTKGLGKDLNNKVNGMRLNFTYNNWGTSCRNMVQYCSEVIAVHEFGHALGFAHEHNRPDTPSNCTEPAQGTSGDIMVGAWDLSSVMNYCNPEYSGNGVLSATDIEMVKRFYPAPHPLPLPAASPNFSIMNSASGMCVHPNGGSASNGTLAILYEGCEEARLQFTLTAAGSIKHLGTGMCLHPSGGATNPANGTALVFWGGCDEARLRFQWQDNQLRHVSSGKCVQTRGFYRTAILELDACSNSAQQSFKRSTQSGYLLRHSSGLCLKPLDDVSQYPAMNTELILSNNCSLANPRHRFVFTNEGAIRHVASGMCVHPAGGNAMPINGTRLVLFPLCSGSNIVFSHSDHIIRQTSSGKCVHPSGGAAVPASGTHAVIWDGCVNEPKVNFFGQLPDSLRLF